MIKKRTIVIASKNKNKVNEIINLLNDFPVVIKTLADFSSIPDIEEDGKSFDENAYKKSSFTSRMLGLPAIADDSGLVIPALKGAPGIYSARYAGVKATDFQRCEKVLKELKKHLDRRAYFKCVLSLSTPNGKALTYEGRCDGTITERMIGENGFGYDPLFFFNQLNKTFAQMTSKEKNLVSHRGIALKRFKKEFSKILSWIDFQIPIEKKISCHCK